MSENPKEIRLRNGSILAHPTQSGTCSTVTNVYVAACNTVERHPSIQEGGKEQRSLRKCYLERNISVRSKGTWMQLTTNSEHHCRAFHSILPSFPTLNHEHLRILRRQLSPMQNAKPNPVI